MPIRNDNLKDITKTFHPEMFKEHKRLSSDNASQIIGHHSSGSVKSVDIDHPYAFGISINDKFISGITTSDIDYFPETLHGVFDTQKISKE